MVKDFDLMMALNEVGRSPKLLLFIMRGILMSDLNLMSIHPIVVEILQADLTLPSISPASIPNELSTKCISGTYYSSKVLQIYSDFMLGII